MPATLRFATRSLVLLLFHLHTGGSLRLLHATARPRSQPCLASAVPPPALKVTEAEPGFVDDENLEADESLVRALKAFDGSGTLLSAGALLQRHSDSSQQPVHECWIADSIEPGIGPNVQLRGAQSVLDALFLSHLQQAGVKRFALHAGSGRGATAATRAAARSRGFVVEATCEDTAESLLLFDRAAGLACYEAVLAGTDPSDADAATVQELVTLLRSEVAAASGRISTEVKMLASDGGRRSRGLSSEWRRLLSDLGSDEWQPLQTTAAWRNPCFVSSFLTAVSVWASAAKGLFVPFGVGPLLVLLSSILYWVPTPRAKPFGRAVLPCCRSPY